MAEADWQDPAAKTLGMLLSGEAGVTHLTESGEPEPDMTFLVWLNASHLDMTVRNPALPGGHRWHVVADTMAAGPKHNAAGARTMGGKPAAASKKGRMFVAARSSLILVRTEADARDRAGGGGGGGVPRVGPASAGLY
jgi:glycogen operon protein